MVAFGQGYASMNAPTKRLEQLVIAGQLAHGGNPVLRWMADNVSLETDAADNWKPSKKRSRERIDGIVATIMGVGLLLERPIPEGPTWSITFRQSLASIAVSKGLWSIPPPQFRPARLDGAAIVNHSAIFSATASLEFDVDDWIHMPGVALAGRFVAVYRASRWPRGA